MSSFGSEVESLSEGWREAPWQSAPFCHREFMTMNVAISITMRLLRHFVRNDQRSVLAMAVMTK